MSIHIITNDKTWLFGLYIHLIENEIKHFFLNGHFIILETPFCLLQQKQSTWFEDRNDVWGIYIINQECATTKVRQLSSVTTFFRSTFGHPVMSSRQFSLKEFVITTHFYNYVQTKPIHDVAGQIIFFVLFSLFFFKSLWM